MKDGKRLRLKKFYFHPITIYIMFIVVIIILSGIFSVLQMQSTYRIVNENTFDLDPTLIAVENLFSFSGFKYLISNATKNFLSFGPLASLIISLIGITVAEATGLIETFSKKYLKKIPKNTLTFLVIFLATISSLINDVGFGILIPLVALIYFINGRNPILGIVTAFCGVSFGYGVSIFVGSTEVALMDYTKSAAMLIDDTTHISLTSNLFFIIAASFILSIVGTIIIEKIVSTRVGKYKKEDEFATTEQYKVISLEEEEQKKIEKEKNEKKGLKYSLIVAIIFSLFIVYSLIPNLPSSGMLLDMNESTYLKQLFGENSYFQDGFTYMVSLFFVLTGLAYGIGAKSIKNDRELIEKANTGFSNIGSSIILLFIAAQFIALFKKSNIGIIITSWLANLLGLMNLSGIALIVVSLIFIAISNLFLTGATNKWMIFSPVLVPMFMQSNISPQFAQIVMRAGDSMTNGFTPLLAASVIYIAYLNIYNLNKGKPYTIRRAFSLISPYFILISLTWILLVVGWYIIGLPIGPNVFPTI